MKVCSLDLEEISRNTTCHGMMYRNGPQPHDDVPEAISSLFTSYQGLPICQSLSYVSGLLGLSSCCFYLVGLDLCTLVAPFPYKNSDLLTTPVTLHAKFRGAPKKTADEEADALPASLSFPIGNAAINVAQPAQKLNGSEIFKPSTHSVLADQTLYNRSIPLTALECTCVSQYQCWCFPSMSAGAWNTQANGWASLPCHKRCLRSRPLGLQSCLLKWSRLKLQGSRAGPCPLMRRGSLSNTSYNLFS